MGQIHDRLMEKDGAYAKWHAHPLHGVAHFLTFLAIAIVSTAFLVTSINAYNSIGEPSSPKPRTVHVWKKSEQSIKEGEIRSPEQILEINFAYNVDAKPSLSLGTVQVKSGYEPKHENEKGGYTAQVLDQNKKVIEKIEFQIPLEVNDPPPQAGDKISKRPSLIKKTNFTITLGWVQSATTLEIRSPKGVLVTSSDLLNIPVIQNKAEFYSLPGEEAKDPEPTSLIHKILPSALAANDPSKLDITFIGSNYLNTSDLNIFHSDVDKFTSYLLTFEPFKSRAGQILFHYVDNTSTDLGCYYDINTPRLLICDGAKATAAVNTAGAPYDKIVVIVNNATYGGSGGPIAVSYNGAQGAQVFVHEFGHALGGLKDEYTYGGNGVSDGTIQQNCYAGTPPAAPWSNLVNSADYTMQCSYDNWYRSTPGSIMYSLSYPYFNAVSKVLLNQKIDEFAGPVVQDTVAPSVPQNIYGNATDSTHINFSWTASTDNIGVSGYKVFRNSTQIGASVGNSYSDSTVVSGNSYNYSVSAYDAAGNNSPQSASTNITTPTAPVAPVALYIVSSSVTKTSTTATVNWSTNLNSTGTVTYNVSNGPTLTATDPVSKTSHSLTLTGLKARTSYSYKITATDGNSTVTTSGSFKTNR